MDANKIKINRKRRLGNTSISDFFKPKVCNTDGNNNASSSVISKDSEQGKGNDSNQFTLLPVVTTPVIQTSASVSTTPVIQTSASVSTTPVVQTSASVSTTSVIQTSASVSTTPDIQTSASVSIFIEDRIPLFIFEISPLFLDQGGNSPPFINSWQHLCISRQFEACSKHILLG